MGGQSAPPPVTPASAPQPPIPLGDLVPTPSSGGYYVPGFSEGSPGAGSQPSSVPAAPSPSFTPTPYDLNSDPWVIFAKNQNTSGLADLQKQYALQMQEINQAGSGYHGDGGVAAAQLALSQARQDSDAQKGVLAHNLPLTLLQIVNKLAAHGMSNSGDAGFLPGEANYEYNTNLDTLNRNLDFKKQNIQLAQQQQAAAQAAYASDQSKTNALNLQKLNLWLEEQKKSYADDLAKAYITAYTNAQQNPALSLTSTGDLSSILKQLGGGA